MSNPEKSTSKLENDQMREIDPDIEANFMSIFAARAITTLKAAMVFREGCHGDMLALPLPFGQVDADVFVAAYDGFLHSHKQILLRGKS